MWSFFLLSFCAGILGSFGAAVPRAKCDILFQKDGYNASNSVTAWGGVLNNVQCKVFCSPEIPLAPAIQWFRMVNSKPERVSVFRKRVYYTKWRFGRTATLTFKNFLEEDVGEYMCKAWLGARLGWAERSVHVKYGCHAPSFLCDNSRCLAPNKHCDGIADCNDGYDEGYCDDSNCAFGEFACDSKCIEKSFRCDGFYDCDDESDEEGCACDFETEFECGDGSCIDKDKVCDGAIDCNADADDESECKEPSTPEPTTPAPTTTTAEVEQTAVDQSADCFNEEFDYSNYNGLPPCSELTTILPSTPAPTTEQSEQPEQTPSTTEQPEPTPSTTEGTTSAAPNSSTDGGINGKDKDSSSTTPQTIVTEGQDEFPTTTEATEACFPDVELECPDGQCIPIAWQCDGVADCLDDFDESETLCRNDDENVIEDIGCLASEFECEDGLCVNASAICDVKLDCSAGEDEDGCGCADPSDFMCHDSKSCIPKEQTCDFISDCEDDSDETWCNNGMSCPEGMFTCEDKTICLPSKQKCDGIFDCDDSSDEAGCQGTVDEVVEAIEVFTDGPVIAEAVTAILSADNPNIGTD